MKARVTRVLCETCANVFVRGVMFCVCVLFVCMYLRLRVNCVVGDARVTSVLYEMCANIL